MNSKIQDYIIIETKKCLLEMFIMHYTQSFFGISWKMKTEIVENRLEISFEYYAVFEKRISKYQYEKGDINVFAKNIVTDALLETLNVKQQEVIDSEEFAELQCVINKAEMEKEKQNEK